MSNWRRLRLSKQSPTPRWRCQYMLTRLGFHFAFVAAFAMVGGALRGFNLLLILAGLLVGAMLMQWRYSRAMINALKVQRRLPTEAIAGIKFRVRYRVRNTSRLTPAWMLWVEDRFGQGRLKRSRVGRHEDVVGKCAVGFVSPRSTAFSHVDCVFAQRGRYRVGPLAVGTTFPFSLLTTRKRTDAEETFYVFPKLLELRSGWHKRLLSRSDGVLPGAQRSGLADGDFFGLREWQSGDNPRWIHWRTTARLGELTVRQFEQHRRFDICLLIDGFGPTPRDDGLLDADSDVERAISLAATLIVHLGAQPINRVMLAVAATRAGLSEGGQTGESQRLMLQQLSELKPHPAPELLSAVQQCAKQVGPTRDLIVISPRSFNEAVSADAASDGSPSLQKCLAPWIARETFRWLDVRQPDVTHWVGGPAAAEQLHEGAN